MTIGKKRSRQKVYMTAGGICKLISSSTFIYNQLFLFTFDRSFQQFFILHYNPIVIVWTARSQKSRSKISNTYVCLLHRIFAGYQNCQANSINLKFPPRIRRMMMENQSECRSLNFACDWSASIKFMEEILSLWITWQSQ